MNITTKIIITDTNIITDLSNANLLNKFIKLHNVYISDMVLHDEINSNTGNVDIISKMKTIELTNDQLIEAYQINDEYKRLSIYDCINYIIARDVDGVLATGDRRLIKLANENKVETIRTLKIIELIYTNKIITHKELINGLNLLKNNIHTRIPIEDIDELIKKYIYNHE